MDMNLEEVTKKIGCSRYYILELDANRNEEDCEEYMVDAEDIDPELMDCRVMDYDVVSKDFAVLYVDVTPLYDEPEINKASFVERTHDLVKAIRGVVGDLDLSVTLTIKTDPKRRLFTVAVGDSINIPFTYEEEE